jgi:hypothetical protein
MKPITLSKEKIAAYAKLTAEVASELSLTMGTTDDDIVKNLITTQIEAFVAQAQKETQTVVIEYPPQGLWNWLLRRKQTFTFTANCRELMRKPPVFPLGHGFMVYDLTRLTDL